MQHPLVVEQHHVALLPVVRVHQPRTDPGPLQPVHNLPYRRQVPNHLAARQVDPAHGRRVDLQRELARDGVLPDHGEDLHFGRVDGRELRGGELEVFGDEAEPVGARFGAAHPDVGVRGVLDAAGSDEFLVRGGEQVVHFVSAHEGRGAQRDVQLVARPVVVTQCLPSAFGHRHRQQRCHLGRVEVVERRVDVPAVEVRVREVVLVGDGVLVELLVVGVDELDVGEAFVLGHEAVADDLHFGLVRDGLEIRVQDAAFGVEGLAVAVADGGWVEAMGQVELGFGGAGGLVLEDDYVGFVECVADDGEVMVCDASVSIDGAMFDI